MKASFIVIEVEKYLISIGYSKSTAAACSSRAGEYYTKSACNSKDVFKDCCDFAGKIAEQTSGVKYKSPKAKSKPRAKRPPSAFDF